MNSRKLILGIGAILFFGLLASCQARGGATPSLSSSPTTSSQESTAAGLSSVGTPQAEKSSIAGWVINQDSSKPIGGISLRLAPVFRQGNDGAYVLDEARSPAAVARSDGFFVFENIDPGEYVLIVGDVESAYEVIPGPNGKPRIWKAEAGKVLNIGEIKSTVKQ